MNDSMLDSHAIFLGTISAALVVVSGLCAGLTLGLLSLDKFDIAILKRSSERENELVTRIEPLITQHSHWLLVSLLLTNSVCMEALPIFLDRLFNPYAAIVISVTAILLFGEIIPQAVCKRYGLEIGSRLSPLVWTLMYATSPVSYPIAKLLDISIGHSNILFRRQEIDHIVQAHAEGDFLERGQSHHQLTTQEAEVIHGTLAMNKKRIFDAITPLDDVYWISSEEVYDRKLETEIIEKGRSRVPVQLCDGRFKILLVKELLLLPKKIFERKQMVKDIPEIMELLRDVEMVERESEMFSVMRTMIDKRIHLMLVIDNETGNWSKAIQDGDPSIGQDENFTKEPLLEPPKIEAFNNEGSPVQVIGIICLEDILEEILTQEIDDETDRPQQGKASAQQIYKQKLIDSRKALEP